MCVWSYGWVKGVIHRGLDTLNLSLWAKISLGGVVIFLVTMIVQTLLFSGQHSLHSVVELGLKTSVLTLIVLSFAKLLFLEISLWSGWTGGDIFPITFAAFLQGFAVAQVFPQVDSLFVSWSSACPWQLLFLKRSGWQVFLLACSFPFSFYLFPC